MFPSKFPFSAGIVRCHVWLVKHGDGIGVINDLLGCTSSTPLLSACCMAGSARATSGPSSTVPESKCRKCNLRMSSPSMDFNGSKGLFLLVTLRQHLATRNGIAVARWFTMICHFFERWFSKTMINYQRAIHKKLVVGLVLVTVSCCWIRHDIPMIHQDPGFTRKLDIGSISQDI